MSAIVHEPIAFVRRSKTRPTEVMMVLRPEEEGCFSNSAIENIAGLAEVESASSLSGDFPCTTVGVKVWCPASLPTVIDRAQEFLGEGFVTHRLWQLMDEGPDA